MSDTELKLCPPAFPNDPRTDPTGFSGGMTLRDYFAGQTLPFVKVDGLLSPEENLKAIANGAYKIADAMLAERTKEQSNG